MSGIYLAAFFTTLAAVAIFGPLIYKLQLPSNHQLLWLAALLVVPLQPLAFYWIRIPLDHWLAGQLGSSSITYQWLTSLYAPLTEEPMKLVPLLVPMIRADIRPANFARYALAIGLGFAIGEMWFVAGRVAQIKAMEGLPFYQFGGYAVERLMTCIFHGAFVSVALWQWRRRFLWGIAGAMTLHWLGNLPLQLMAQNAGGLGRTFWMVTVQLWLFGYCLAAASLLAYFAFGQFALGRLLFGRSRCPECNQGYDAPLFGLNFGPSRYEHCPGCRKWHWIHKHDRH
ncbi:MAG: hypothetical protein JWL90_2080 [Chthoniobacteraceae bacterium]|nr:hypothetical protein [Chthoniobacteraceae bacterium]